MPKRHPRKAMDHAVLVGRADEYLQMQGRAGTGLKLPALLAQSTPSTRMADAVDQNSSRQSSASRFLRQALGYWTSGDRKTAWFWTISALLLVLANLAVNVGINRWNKWFFDALEGKRSAELLPLAALIVVLVAVGAAFAVLMVRCRMTLQVKWRQWLTDKILAHWLSDQRYYRLAVTDESQINPEFRIADDLRLASDPIVEFAIGFINALFSAVTFVSILFIVGGSISLSIGVPR